MLRHALLAVTFFLATLLIFAQDNSQPAWSGSYTADLKTRYFGPTVSKTFANQGVLQQELDVTRQFGGTSVTGSLWNSTGFNRFFENNASETDLGIAAERKVRKIVLSGTAGIYFLNPTAGFHVLQLDFKASRTFARGKNTFTPFVEFQNRWLTNKVAIHGSSYPMVGIAYGRKFSKRFSLGTMFRENYDLRGGFGQKSGTSLFYSETSLRVALTDSLSIVLPRVGFGGSYHDPERPTQFTWSAGIAKTF